MKPAEPKIIELYRQGYGHADIVSKTRAALADVRRVISEATKDDEKLYRQHKSGE